MGMIPEGVRGRVEDALGARLTGVRRVGGGCISPAARVETEAGDRLFVKWAEAGEAPAGFFEAEAESLAELNATRTVRVPAVVAVGEGWLVLEWLEPGGPSGGTMADLGRALAALHRHSGDRYGWERSNWIGSLPQANDPSADWATFWRDRRLMPQLERAYAGGYFRGPERRRFDRLLDRLEEWLAPVAAEAPSLLHGDLWSGNVHVLASGEAALVDPSCYRGHREVDLAMTELFGGFGDGFRAAYEEAWPLLPGYAESRRAVYQLYYLLVHVNLFGDAYVNRTLSLV